MLGLGQRRGGVGSPNPPYNPQKSRTPLGVTHWLVGAPWTGGRIVEQMDLDAKVFAMARLSSILLPYLISRCHFL